MLGVAPTVIWALLTGVVTGSVWVAIVLRGPFVSQSSPFIVAVLEPMRP